MRNISWRITRLASSNQGSSTQFRRLGRIDARDWTRERRVISRRHKMRAAGVEVTTAGNEDKGSRRRPTGKCISTRYHLPVFYPRYAYTPIRAYVRDACARQPVALYTSGAQTAGNPDACDLSLEIPRKSRDNFSFPRPCPSRRVRFVLRLREK